MMEPGANPQQLPTTERVERVAEVSANPIRRVLWGPNGLRALWRFLIFLGIQICLQFAIGYAFFPQRRFATTSFTPQIVMLWDGLRLVTVLLAALIMAYFEKLSLRDYGLPARGAFGLRFWEGVVWGFFAQSATIMILYVTGNVSFQGLDQRGRAALYFGLMWAAAFVIVGLFEEFLFRGYPQFTLASGIGFWPAAILLSGLFWLGHAGNPGETWIGGLSTALAALTFCVTLWLTGNLWFAIGMHAGWDWTETYFFGVADSGMPANGHLLNTVLQGSKWMTGGTVGPEGSVVEVGVILLVTLLLFLRFGSERRVVIAQPVTRTLKRAA